MRSMRSMRGGDKMPLKKARPGVHAWKTQGPPPRAAGSPLQGPSDNTQVLRGRMPWWRCKEQAPTQTVQTPSHSHRRSDHYFRVQRTVRWQGKDSAVLGSVVYLAGGKIKIP